MKTQESKQDRIALAAVKTELARVGLATDYTDFAEFEKQHKKAYPKATDEEIEKAWKNYVAHMEKSKAA